MENMILSLKNLYMLLMTEDFPIYSESVIGRIDRKGLTMLRFWHSQLVEAFRCLPCGRMIWRNTGKRNRYTSYLCNRNAEIKTYSEYARELAQQVSVPTLLSQIGRFSEFLSGRKYKHDILLRRIREYLRLIEVEDPRVTPEIAGQIRTATEDPGFSAHGNRERLFHGAYLLTMLMLYAAAGEAMDDSALCVLRNEKYRLDALWQAYSQPQNEQHQPVTFLSVHSPLLQDDPKSHAGFFGREEDLFDLSELIAAGGKCLITGIGGIGKTALLKQLLWRCCTNRLADKLALVSGEDGIRESFVHAFPGFQRQDPSEVFPQILHLLEREAQTGKLLLLIDDFPTTDEDTEDITALSKLPCAVIITSRRESLAGFTSLRLASPGLSTSALIFRDNYGLPLKNEDRIALQELLQDETLRHPLTLRLLSRAARSKGWSITQLTEQMHKGFSTLSWQERDRTIRLSTVYRQLYALSQIHPTCQNLAELFTLLPRDSYSPEFLGTHFTNLTDDPETLTQKLGTLVSGGWLERTGDGYAMHPLIAQCLRRAVINQRYVMTYFAPVVSRMLSIGVMDGPESDEDTLLRLCRILGHVAGLLTGALSSDLLTGMVNALSISEHTDQTLERYTKLLQQLYKRCTDLDDTAKAACLRTLCRWRRCDGAQIKPFCLQQMERQTIPDRLRDDLFLAAGYQLKYCQETAFAKKLFVRVLDNTTDPTQKATAYFYLYELCQVTGDYAGCCDWSQAGADYVRAHPECGEALIFTNLFALGASHLKSRKAIALSALESMRNLLRSDSPVWCKTQYTALSGTYELLYGSPEMALEHYLQQREYILTYQGQSYAYYNVQGQIGQVLRLLKRHDEALDIYSAILSYAHSNGQKALWQRISCTAAGVYLDLHRPEDALAQLLAVDRESRSLGGQALAEALFLMAQAHGQLHNPQQQQALLREAIPLLTQVYGDDHPKVICAREMLTPAP